MDKTETLAWLRRISGDLATATIKRLEDTLPWYAEMPPARRSAVGLVAQAGITSFIQWYDDPKSTPWIAADIFAAAPRELLRSVSLQQTLQLIRVTVEVTEERVAGKGEHLREAILLYSREVAFAAADVYARAAEARGLWDARLEALVVDSILTGEADEELPSRIAALGWHGHGEVAVLVGTTPPLFDVDQLRRTARKLGVDVLIGVQGSRLVLVLGRAEPPNRADERARRICRSPRSRKRLEPGFGTGHLVLGPAGAGARRREPERPRGARRASPSRGRGATRRARSRPTTCCPSAPSPAIRSRSRRSSSASTARCRRTAPTSSRRCGATSTTAARSRRPPASCSCTRTPCATASSASPRSSAGMRRARARRSSCRRRSILGSIGTDATRRRPPGGARRPPH